MPRIDRDGERGDGIGGEILDGPLKRFLTAAARLASISLVAKGRRVNEPDVDDACQISYISLRTRVENKWGGDPDRIIADAFKLPPDDNERDKWVRDRLNHVVGEAVMMILYRRLRDDNGNRAYVPRHPNVEPTTVSQLTGDGSALDREHDANDILGTTGLSERQRVILKGKFDGSTHEQIAAQIGVSVDTVKDDWAKIKIVLANSIRPT